MRGFTLNLAKLTRSWQVVPCSVFNFINWESRRSKKLFHELIFPARRLHHYVRSEVWQHVQLRSASDQSAFFTLLSASLSHHLAETPHQGQCDASRTFHGVWHVKAALTHGYICSIKHCTIFPWSLFVPSLPLKACSLLLTRQLVWKCWWMWHPRQKHETGAEEKRRTGGAGCSNEWRVGLIKVQVLGSVRSVGSEVLIWPEAAWRLLMSREHIALCLAFLLPLCLCLHYVSLPLFLLSLTSRGNSRTRTS